MTISDDEFEEQPQVVPQNQPAQTTDTLNAYLDKAGEYVSFAYDTATTKATEAAAVAKTKADETGMTQVVTENASYMGKSLADLGESAKNKAFDVKQQYQDGSLVENTKSGISTAATSLGGFASSWLSKAKAYAGGSKDNTEKPAEP